LIRKSKLSKTLFVLPLSPFSLATVIEIDVLEVGTQNIPNLLLKLESYQHLNKIKGTIALESNEECRKRKLPTISYSKQQEASIILVFDRT